MGLLSVATGKNAGLLKKAQEASRLTFQQWAEDKGIEHCGVFCEQGGLMMLKLAYGIDAPSVFSSISTKDFWTGSIRSNNWVTLDRDSPNFTAFTQFLSPEARRNVRTFRILKVTDQDKLNIFFAYSDKPAGLLRASAEFSAELLSVMKSHAAYLIETPTCESVKGLTQDHKARLCLISTKRALDETTKNIEVSELTIQKILTTTIFEEIFFRTKKLFASPGAIYSEDSAEIKAAAIINSGIEDEILKEQLFLEYRDLIGDEAAKKIIILTAGYSDIDEEILDYLLRG